MCVCDNTVAVEEREEDLEVLTDNSSTQRDLEELTGNETDAQKQTSEEQAKLKSLINSNIKEKLEQLQVGTHNIGQV